VSAQSVIDVPKEKVCILVRDGAWVYACSLGTSLGLPTTSLPFHKFVIVLRLHMGSGISCNLKSRWFLGVKATKVSIYVSTDCCYLYLGDLIEELKNIGHRSLLLDKSLPE